MIQIDGSFNEGGGQILRTALAMSGLTGKGFEINNIRAGRCNPGLQAQHLCCVNAFQKICNAHAEGAETGSQKIIFEPGKIIPGKYELDIGTAGSITLLMQSLLPALMFAGKKTTLDITGGTDVKWSQPIDYFREVLLPHLQKYAEIECKIMRRGYYPKGDGKIEITIKPRFNVYNFSNFGELKKEVMENTQKIDLMEQGYLMFVKGASHASSNLEKASVAERQVEAATELLKKLGCSNRIQIEYRKTASTGSGITLWAMFSKDKEEISANNPIIIGADSLGERGKPAEEVGREAAEKLVEEIKYSAPVDECLADNLIPFLAIGGGQFRAAKISSHTQTNIYIVEKFLGKVFEMGEKEKIIRA